MSWFVIIGMVLSGWTLLLLLSRERQRRLIEIEAKQQHDLVEVQKQHKKQQQVPTVS